MTCCKPSQQKWAVLGLAIFLLVFGIILAVLWSSIFHSILIKELSLSNEGTAEFKMWKKTPIPMYIEFYLFNWTNHADVVKSHWKVKPEFEEHGPYTYSEVHLRKAIQFNDNGTLTYKTQRIWHFLPEKSKGQQNDLITTLNPIAATVGYFVRDRHPIVKIGVNFFLQEKNVQLTTTKTARQWLFDGYDDPMLDLLHKLNSSAINVPFDKFGWFYSRNESIDYDGSFTIYDGSRDIRKLGSITLWNGSNRTECYPGNCGMVNGTSGELWFPIQDDMTASVFSPDTCSTLTLVRSGNDERYGVPGHRFIGDKSIFDNGTEVPEMACFSPGEVLPSGVRNVSQCKYGAPAFISFPHFYLADPYYSEPIVGMKPDKRKHEFFISIEPETGIPLKVNAAMQLNLMLMPIDRITMFEHVKKMFIPAMWFRQTAELDESLASMAKMLLVLPDVGHYTGYGIIGIGVLLLVVWGFVVYKKGWRGGENEHLLGQDTLNYNSCLSTAA